uniref:Protein kinase domain-containing protein n=1 Tax=Mastacembelus armatus TaxID=205130 RepID=A0A7N8WPJ9_9TELE
WKNFAKIDSTRYLVMDIMGEGSYGQVFKCLNLITGKTTAKKNIVKFTEDFKSHDCSCLPFEMLDKSLWNLMTEKEGKSLSLNEIRPVTQQLMVAFEALKDLGIMHLDLKPDNVMLVNHKDQPFRIKLIDFGLAHPVGLLKAGVEMQAVPYRAPEVMLGLPLSEAVDVWGYFSRDHDRMAFLSLLKGCLHFDPARRICSGEALKHRFITMVHLIRLLIPHMENQFSFMFSLSRSRQVAAQTEPGSAGGFFC